MKTNSDKTIMSDFYKRIKNDQNRILFIKNTLTKFIQDGVDLSTQVYFGQTLLHIALRLNNIKLFKIFLEFNVNPEIANDIGDTPLHRAVKLEKTEFVKELIKKGIDLNITTLEEKTALHLAVIRGNLKIVKMLVESGIDVTIVDDENLSAYDLALLENKKEIVIYLKEALEREKNERKMDRVNK